MGARGNLATFGFYPNKQLTTGEGGALVCPDADVKARVDSERNQGRAPDMGWLDHDRLGLQLPAVGPGLLARHRPGGAPGRDARRARGRGARSTREGLADIEGLDLPCPDAGGDRRSWFVYVVQLPRGATATPRSSACASQGIDSKPYLPAIHLMSFYRDLLGHREGDFPVCEDVAARSLALPFYPELSEGQVERVISALAERARAGYSSSLISETPAGIDPVRRRAARLLEARALGRALERAWLSAKASSATRGRPRPARLAVGLGEQRAATPRRRACAAVASEST